MIANYDGYALINDKLCYLFIMYLFNDYIYIYISYIYIILDIFTSLILLVEITTN